MSRETLWKIEKALKDSPGNFEKEIKDPNKSRLEALKGKISQELWNILTERWVVVWTTWSDWRLENLPHSSRIDLVIYDFWNRNGGEEISGNLREIDATIENVEIVPIIEGWEVLYYWRDNKPGVFFPTRFLDLHLLGWDETHFQSLWKNFVDNLSSLPWKKYKEFIDRLRIHKNALRNWYTRFKGQKLLHFYPDFDKIAYSRINGIESGVKISHLRPVQYLLAHEIFKKIRNKEIYNLRDLIELDKSIKDKAMFLNQEYGTNIENEILESYVWFLWIHLIMKGDYEGDSLVIPTSQELQQQLKAYHTALLKLFGF